MRTHEGPHGGANYDEDCYGCVLKAKDISLGAGATPSRQPHGPPKMRPITQPSWEAGVAGEHRPGGGFMPYLDRSLEPIGVKEFADRRHQLTSERTRQLNDPNYGRSNP